MIIVIQYNEYIISENNMINSNNNNDKNFVTSSEIPPPRNFSKNIDGLVVNHKNLPHYPCNPNK